MQKDGQDVGEVLDHAIKDLGKAPTKLLVLVLMSSYTISLMLSL